MWRKKKPSVEEANHQIRINKMRTALYDMLWDEVHKDMDRPLPRPLVTSNRDWIQEELKEIING